MQSNASSGAPPRILAGHRRSIEKILGNGWDVNAVSLMSHSVSPLMWAAHHGLKQECGQLLDAGAKINAKDGTQGRTALLWAAAGGHAEVCTLLVSRGADPKTCDAAGRGAWHWGFPFPAMRAWLLERSFNPNISDCDGFTPLHCAAEHGNEDACRDLVEVGADPYARNVYGYTPVHSARVGEHSSVHTLLQEAADTRLALARQAEEREEDGLKP